MGGVRAKIGLTGQLDRRQPGNYFKPCHTTAQSSHVGEIQDQNRTILAKFKYSSLFTNRDIL